MSKSLELFKGEEEMKTIAQQSAKRNEIVLENLQNEQQKNLTQLFSISGTYEAVRKECISLEYEEAIRS